MKRHPASLTRQPALRAALFCAALWTVPAFGQAAPAPTVPKPDDSPITLDTVTVTTATRGEKAIDKIPGAVTVLTSADLDRQYSVSDDLAKALAASVPGFSAPRGKQQGLGETIRGRAILYLLDGIPQSNPLRAGLREGYFMDTALVQRIEVLSGPSAVHGLGGAGGVVNYITRAPGDEGVHHFLSTKVSSQFEPDSLKWKAAYSLALRKGAYDVVVFGSRQENGIAYDAKGRTIGIDTDGGDLADIWSNDLFVKVGWSPKDQRVEFSYNHFESESNGEWQWVTGNRAARIPTTSVRGPLLMGIRPNNNLFDSGNLSYKHFKLGGGTLAAQVFFQSGDELFARAFPIRGDFQDARIAPLGTLPDQSKILSDKKGTKVTWIRPDLFADGLELTAGFDYLNTETNQILALTGRQWVPLVKYDNYAGFVQAEFERGPFLVRGGVREEKGELNVPTFTTLAATRPPAGATVDGGRRTFRKAIPNLGAIWRFTSEVSAFVSYSEGLGLPDVGGVLRVINRPNQDVDTLIDLRPVITKNHEIGVSYRGKIFSASSSYYESKSAVGDVIRVDPATGAGLTARIPVEIKGFEFQGEARPTRDWRLTALFSTLRGKTAVDQGQPLNLMLGARNQGPNKLVLGAGYKLTPKARIGLEQVTLFSRDINIGRRTPTGGNLEEHFNGYSLLDLTGSYETRFGTISLGIENVLDEYYITYYAQANASSVTNNTDYYAGRGRTVTLSYQVKF